MVFELTTCLAMVTLVHWAQTFVLVAAWSARAEKLLAILQSAVGHRGSLEPPGASQGFQGLLRRAFRNIPTRVVTEDGRTKEEEWVGWSYRLKGGSPGNNLIAKPKLNKPANATHLKKSVRASIRSTQA